jgi:5-methyltetrahydropteroyltriglutamate--homocysteine methyltransferase
VVRRQEELGLESITDGEFGRSSWFGFFFERLEGFRAAESRFRFRDADGHEHAWQTCCAAAPMRRTRAIAVEEFQRVRDLARAVPKACLPSPSALHFFRGDDCYDRGAYPELGAWWSDLRDIYRAEITALADAGCRYLQLDEVPLAMLCDRRVREQVAAQGLDPIELAERYVEFTNEVLDAAPATMVRGVHMCRGNFRSRWMAEGGYEPVAERVFGGLEVDVFFLEFDTERAGGFEPLRYVTGSKQVVLGLVSTKTPELEAVETLVRRVEGAARVLPLDRLALSPQCGFASVAGGNPLDEDQQFQKLARVVECAEQVWA